VLLIEFCSFALGQRAFFIPGQILVLAAILPASNGITNPS
jgi:hypothetical protein